jgi:hypothetical protein
MLKHARVIGLIAVAAMLAAGCTAALAGLLIYQLLDDEAPTRTWTGTVIDTEDQPVGGVLVQVRAEVAGKDDFMNFSDTTNLDGEYTVKFRWNSDVLYSIRVVHEGTVYAEESLGEIELDDRQTDFTVDLSAPIV